MKPSSDNPSQAASISQSLLERVQRHETDAWHKLVFLYEPVIVDWCCRRGVPIHESSDIAQEVFRAVSEGIGTFRRETPEDTFRGWLYRITRHKIQDYWRRQQRAEKAIGGTQAQLHMQEFLDHREPLEEPAPDPSDEDGLYQRALSLMRNDFAEATWKAFLATTVDGRRAVDVAQEIGITVGAVYVAKSRVLCRLREELAGLEGF